MQVGAAAGGVAVQAADQRAEATEGGGDGVHLHLPPRHIIQSEVCSCAEQGTLASSALHRYSLVKARPAALTVVTSSAGPQSACC